MTLAPTDATARAMALPMPLVDPVTSARNPASSRPCLFLASSSSSPTRAAENGMNHVRRDFCQRQQHKQSIVQARMRHGQIGFVKNGASVEKQIEIDGARAVGSRRILPSCCSTRKSASSMCPADRSVCNSAAALR